MTLSVRQWDRRRAEGVMDAGRRMWTTTQCEGPRSLSRPWIFSLSPGKVCLCVRVKAGLPWGGLRELDSASPLCQPVSLAVNHPQAACRLIGREQACQSGARPWPYSAFLNLSAHIFLLTSQIYQIPWLFPAAYLKTDARHFGAFLAHFYCRNAPLQYLDRYCHPYRPFKMDWVVAGCDRSNFILFVGHGHYCQAPNRIRETDLSQW